VLRRETREFEGGPRFVLSPQRGLAIMGFLAFWSLLLLAVGLMAEAALVPLAVGALVAVAALAPPAFEAGASALTGLVRTSRTAGTTVAWEVRRAGEQAAIVVVAVADRLRRATAAAADAGRAAGRRVPPLARAAGERVRGGSQAARAAAGPRLSRAGAEARRIGSSAAAEVRRIGSSAAGRARTHAGAAGREAQTLVVSLRGGLRTHLLGAWEPEARGGAVDLSYAVPRERRERRVEEAIAYCERSLGIARRTGDRRGEALTLNILAVALTQAGDEARAIECCRRAMEILGDLEDASRPLAREPVEPAGRGGTAARPLQPRG
jgi:tetratricopeptide (TPR) repeat protein